MTHKTASTILILLLCAAVIWLEFDIVDLRRELRETQDLYLCSPDDDSAPPIDTLEA